MGAGVLVIQGHTSRQEHAGGPHRRTQSQFDTGSFQAASATAYRRPYTGLLVPCDGPCRLSFAAGSVFTFLLMYGSLRKGRSCSRYRIHADLQVCPSCPPASCSYLQCAAPLKASGGGSAPRGTPAHVAITCCTCNNRSPLVRNSLSSKSSRLSALRTQHTLNFWHSACRI